MDIAHKDSVASKFLALKVSFKIDNDLRLTNVKSVVNEGCNYKQNAQFFHTPTVRRCISQ